jgi:inorganic phosphate transporter, PiT family
MILVLCVLLLALAFVYTNGFHDTANAIATSVATKVMTPGQAIFLATAMNLVGALIGDAVAKTIGQGLVDTRYITAASLLCALIAATVWNVFTWKIGLPSSSSHALIGGLVGAAIASAKGNWSAVYWQTGLWPKVIRPMFIAPACGMLAAFVMMAIILVLMRWFERAFPAWRPHAVNRRFGYCQWLSAAWMSFEHGRNDAQKNMGIIALALFTATTAGVFNNLPPALAWLHTPEFTIAFWNKLACALVLAVGTAAGGWKIIRTMGKGLVRLQPVHGFAAQSTAAAVISVATHYGVPLSTTHVINGSIMGVGAIKGTKAVKWIVVERMVWAWVFTLPITAVLSYLMLRLVQLFQ